MQKDIIYKQLLHELGLEINYEGDIIYQETALPVEFNGKRVNMYNEGNKIYFEPFWDEEQSCTLLNYYIAVVQYYDNIYISAYSLIENLNTYALHAVMQNNRVIESNYFKNKCLSYIDLIFKIGGYNIDLTEYDFIKRR